MALPDNTTDVVGIGVDLLGGQDTLTMLRAIRAEMVAIAQLSGRATGGAGQPLTVETQDLRAREKVYMDSNRRIAEDRVRSERRTSQEEINIRAQALNRKNQLNAQINQRAEQLRQEEKRQEIAAQQESARRHQQFLQARKSRIEAISRQENILSQDLGPQRRLLQRYRSDPARDEKTNQFRRQAAETIQGQRTALREQTKLQAEEAALNKRADDEAKRQINRARNVEIERRSQDPNILSRRIPLPSKYRSGGGDLELDYAAQQLAKRRQTEAASQAQWEKELAAKKARQVEQRRQFDADMAIRARQFQIEDQVTRLQTNAATKAAREAASGRLGEGQTTSHVDIYRDVSRRRAQAQDEIVRLSQQRTQAISDNRPASALRQIEQEQRKAINLYQQLTAAEARYLQGTGQTPRAGFGGGGGIQPPGRGGGPRGPRRPTFGDQDQVINPRGFFTSLDAVGRITRNILLYEVVSRASYGLVDYISKSVIAAKTTVEYANALRFATEAAGGNVAENTRLADSLGDIGLSRQQGRAAVTEAVRFAENRPQDTEKLLRVVTDIAAERGGGIDRTDELIEQLRRRESKFYKRIFGKTVESIYEDEAGKTLDKQSTSLELDSGLYVGLKDSEYKTRSQRIAQYVSQMDDAAKETAVFNYILSQQSKFAGEAEKRADTLAGRLDKVSAAFLNGQEGLGLFITDLKVFNNILDTLANKAGFLDSLRGPTLGRTGAGGTISKADVQRFGTETAYGPRARALNAVDTFAPTALLGVGALGALGFLGRRQATARIQQQTYENTMQLAATKFRGDFAAATNEAIFRAQNVKATVTQQVGAGLTRVTTNLAARVNDALYYAADQVGANRVASSAARRAGILRGQIGRIGPGTAVPEGLLGAGQATGGVVGGIAGAVVGSFIADKITSNQIIATGITVLGGVAGTAAGTAVGSAAASAIGTKLGLGGAGAAAGSAALIPAAIAAAAAIIGVAGGIGVERLGANLGYGGSGGRTYYETQQDYKAEEARAGAYREYVRQREQLTQENRIRYRSTRPGSSLNLLTGAEVSARGDAIGDQRGGLQNYIEVILPPLNEAQKAFEQFRKSRQDLIDSINTSDVLPQNVKDQRVAQLSREITQADFDTRNPEWKKFTDDYRGRQAESIADRLAKDKKEADKERNEYVQELGNALAKLRDAQQGSFRLVGDIGTAIAGDENPYVKVLADQITVAERMRQQWGFLGQAAVDYFTKLEQGSTDRQLNKLEFQTYTTASGLRSQADREAAERTGPGLSRREQEYLDIQSAIVAQAVQIPNLWSQAAELLGRTISPAQEFAGRLGLISQSFGTLGPRLRNLYGQDVTPDRVRRNVYGQSLGGYFDIEPRRNVFQQSLEDPTVARMFQGIGAGESPEVRRALQKSFADTILEAFQGLSPGEIRSSGFQDVYLGAIRAQSRNLGSDIDTAREKALFTAREDARLSAQLEADDRFRQSQLAAGRSPLEVGRESDTLLLSRTEGIAAKDLPLQTFVARQEALRRQADRAEQDRVEAKKAVQLGLEYQKQFLEQIQGLRQDLQGGDRKVLVQVQNDTQARVDQSFLQEMASGNYNVPLDQGEAKTNPYSGSFTRYKRGGRKR